MHSRAYIIKQFLYVKLSSAAEQVRRLSVIRCATLRLTDNVVSMQNSTSNFTSVLEINLKRSMSQVDSIVNEFALQSTAIQAV
jgi:hypothetical protein